MFINYTTKDNSSNFDYMCQTKVAPKGIKVNDIRLTERNSLINICPE